ncbi:hypothetical protein ACLB1E_15780 [Escherichia coli]
MPLLVGWRVNGNATMTPTFGTLASPQTYGHTGDRNGDRYRSGESYGDCDVKQQAVHSPVADPAKESRICSKAVSCRLQRMVG